LEWKSTFTAKAFLEYKIHLDRFFEVANKPISQIGIHDIARFQYALRNKFKLSDCSISHSMIVIKNFLKFLVTQGYKVMNPALIRVNKNFVVNSYNPVTPAEFRKMDSVLSEKSLIDLEKKCAINLLWNTGIRVSELCDLNVSQVNETPQALIKNKKNRESRWIFWTPKTHRLLQMYIQLKQAIHPSDSLFCGSSPNSVDRVTSKTIQRWVQETCEKAGIKKKISPHSFRHGKAHVIKSKNGDIFDIAKILGHSNVQSSAHYLKLGPREMKKRAKKFL
jgi:site-specific recombinase XerD